MQTVTNCHIVQRSLRCVILFETQTLERMIDAGSQELIDLTMHQFYTI